jgi:hypothetical protein
MEKALKKARVVDVVAVASRPLDGPKKIGKTLRKILESQE